MGSLNWLYEFRNPGIYYLFTALFGGVIGLIFGVIFRPDSQIKIGNVVYLITRTIFNVLRSIESLVMVIVFVVWVGIGPFAGALALALHTIASLGKMYSEQVENILEGPLEAVQATGANLLQQVVYAVIPQIIPPYIAFTLYRWDQNVRMSTIIGFAGGGGIGFLLQQNINLLNYRAASVQMIAIAVVVSLMDYLSGYVRNKIV
jgi:phosphonate transport system permease protein